MTSDCTQTIAPLRKARKRHSASCVKSKYIYVNLDRIDDNDTTHLEDN